MTSEIEFGGYEPEYSEPANTAWMNRLPCKKPSRPQINLRSSLRMLPTAREEFANELPRAPVLSLVEKRFESSAYQEWQIEEVRRDGTSAILRTAYDLELACVCFQLEADKKALIEVEPHLKRCHYAIGRLTRAAARAKRSLSRPESLFDE